MLLLPTSANHHMKFQESNCKCGVLLLEGGSWLAGLGVHPWRNGAVGRCGGAAGVGQGPWGSRTLDRCAGGGAAARGAGSGGGVPPQSFAPLTARRWAADCPLRWLMRRRTAGWWQRAPWAHARTTQTDWQGQGAGSGAWMRTGAFRPFHCVLSCRGFCQLRRRWLTGL